MKEALLHTPEGVRDIYGEECREKQALIENLTNACRLYGYDSIQTPTMEFFVLRERINGTTPFPVQKSTIFLSLNLIFA